MKVETIKDNGEVLAIIIKGVNTKDSQFFSPEDFPLQIGTINKNKGDKVRAHLHNEPVRSIRATQEVLYVEKGKVRVSIYNSSGKVIAKRILIRGDKILSASGGHGFEILEKTTFFEVKQGPYPGYEKAKTYLE